MIREDSNDSDQSDGPILYRDDDQIPNTKIARKESLSLKLALRPNMDELINRNILHMQSENERIESKEAIGAKLIRRLSMRPTAEELIERNILKSKSSASRRFDFNVAHSGHLPRLCSSIASRGEEAEGGEEALLAEEAQLSSHR